MGSTGSTPAASTIFDRRCGRSTATCGRRLRRSSRPLRVPTGRAVRKSASRAAEGTFPTGGGIRRGQENRTRAASRPRAHSSLQTTIRSKGSLAVRTHSGRDGEGLVRNIQPEPVRGCASVRPARASSTSRSRCACRGPGITGAWERGKRRNARRPKKTSTAEVKARQTARHARLEAAWRERMRVVFGASTSRHSRSPSYSRDLGVRWPVRPERPACLRSASK